MSRPIILFTTLAFSVVFLFFNMNGEMGFPFSDMVLTVETWFYFLFEHIIVLLLAIVILELEHEFKLSARVFVWIQALDTVDYCLTYGESWSNYMPSFNIMKVTVFGIVMLFDWYKWKTQT